MSQNYTDSTILGSNVIKYKTVYVSSDTSGVWWPASLAQSMAVSEFPLDYYTGQGSSYWYGADYADETVRVITPNGKKWSYKMRLNKNGGLYIRTSDRKYRRTFVVPDTEVGTQASV
jgi:hypothetical protein